jgi:hypothetical protein
MENVHEMLLDLRARYDHGKTDPIVNSIRINLVKLIQGLSRRGRDALTAEGFLFSKRAWALAEDHTEKHDMNAYMQGSIIGRRVISEEIREKIRAHVMKDENTKVLPERRKGHECRAFIRDVKEVYNDFPERDSLGYDAFRLLCSGNKASAVGADGDKPPIRKWIHVTDMCQTCPQRQASIITLQQFVTMATTASCNSFFQTTFDDAVRRSCEADPQAGRADRARRMDGICRGNWQGLDTSRHGRTKYGTHARPQPP